MALTLYDVISMPSEELLKKVNKEEPHIPIYEEKNINKNNSNTSLPLKNYYQILNKEDIVIGKKFHLLNNLEVEIIEIDKEKNLVYVKCCIFNYVKYKLKLSKLVKNTFDQSEFPKKGENFYYINKKNEKILITIKYISIVQKSVGFLLDGKKVYVKISKLIPLDNE